MLKLFTVIYSKSNGTFGKREFEVEGPGNAWQIFCTSPHHTTDTPIAVVEGRSHTVQMAGSVEPPIKPLEVGERVKYMGSGSLKSGQIGTIIEVPGPSNKYDGRPAERYEVVLESGETIFSSDSHWDRLVRV